MRDETMGFEYEVALSFAGEQRPYVEAVASSLQDRGVRTFYDEYERANLWGKDLYEHLDYIYQRAARFCIVFASEAYAAKAWTSHERRSAQARAIGENFEYVLPARFDDTTIPGIRSTVGYVDLRHTSPDELADLVVEKLGPYRRRAFFPPKPDRLMASLSSLLDVNPEHVHAVARSAYRNLKRTTPEERELLYEVFTESCGSEWPENLHMSLDLVRRDLGLPATESYQMLQGLGVVGFECQWREGDDDHVDPDMVEVRWHDPMNHEDDSELEEFAFEYSTAVMNAIVMGCDEDRCIDCSRAAFLDLDLSSLSSASAYEGHRPANL